MPAIPLGTNAYKRTNLPEAELRNWYVEKDGSGISPDQTIRIQRPGLTSLASFGVSPIMGIHYRTATGERLTVTGDALYSGSTYKGVLLANDLTAMVSTPFLTLIASNGSVYMYDTAIASLALPDDAPSNGYVRDVDQLNGYGLILLPNGRFYWLVPGTTAIDPLNFATAESLPDGGVAIRRLGDEFWIFGTENIEVWQPTGDLDAPFQRASGRNMERGCLYRDAVRRFDNTLVWIGDDFQVYRAANVPEVISNPGISQRIRNASGPCSAWTFGIDSHSFYVLRIPGQGTFAFDASTRQWSEFASFGQGTWEPWVGYQEAGAIYAGSSVTGNLWQVSADAGDDAGTLIERIITGSIPLIGKPPRNDSFSVGVGSSADTVVRVRWRDGQDDFPAYYDELDIRAPFDVATIWRLGQPDQPYREFEISSVSPETLTLYGAVANEGWA